MTKLYIPSTDSQKALESLLQGFWLDVDENGNIALLVKVESSLCNSIINGVPINIVLRNPNIEKRSYTFYIHDIPKNPFYVTWKNFGDEDLVMVGFDKIAIKLASSKKITLALYNEFTHPIFTSELEITSPTENFDNWLFNIYNLENFKYEEKFDKQGNYFPENERKGFVIKIKNVDSSKVEKIKILAPEYDEKWRNQSPSIKPYFTHDDYVGDGKHGYYQELSITNNLSRFFQPESNFFINPINSNNTEFTDFIIIDEDIAILIESKYVISEKKTKQHSALLKAVNQLRTAENAIIKKNVNLSNVKVSDLLKKTKHIIKICMVNDKLIVTDENSKTLTDKFKKEELPLFISVTSFFEIVGSFFLKNEEFVLKNIMYNFLRLQKSYLNSQSKVWYIRDFSIENLTIEELNELGKKEKKI